MCATAERLSAYAVVAWASVSPTNGLSSDSSRGRGFLAASFASSASSRCASRPSSHCAIPSCSQVGQDAAREATKEWASSCRSTRTRPGVGACEARHGHPDRPVVPGGGPLGCARRVPEAGRGLEHDRHGLRGREPEPLLVLGPRQIEDAQDGQPERLVGRAVVADLEPRARRGRRGREDRVELPLHARLRVELERHPVLLARAHEIGQLGERVGEQLVGIGAPRIRGERRLGGLSRPARVAEGQLGRGERVQARDRRGLAEERQPGEPQGVGRVPGRQPLRRCGRRRDRRASALRSRSRRWRRARAAP